jgi:hypothetical protein
MHLFLEARNEVYDYKLHVYSRSNFNFLQEFWTQFCHMKLFLHYNMQVFNLVSTMCFTKIL